MSQNIVYKTYEINTDVEHYAKPINLSGASTVKLTDLPAGVKCWISTESTGENKFPLINRGDGWVNLPAPLYDLYIYTEGTTLENRKIVLNYTGQNDFFVYGNNSSEKIEQIGQIVSLSRQTIKDVNDAVYNTYMKNVVARFLIQGDWELNNTGWNGVRLAHLPMGIDGRISDLGLDNNKYYRITTQGHFDMGNGLLSDTGSSTEFAMNYFPMYSTTSHFSIFNNTNGATFSKLTSVNVGESGLHFDFDPLYQLDKAAWKTSKDEFNLWGLKAKESFGIKMVNSSSFFSIQGAFVIPNGLLNTGSENIYIRGDILNSYENFGVFWTCTNYRYVNPATTEIYVNASPNCHASLIVEVSEVIS